MRRFALAAVTIALLGGSPAWGWNDHGTLTLAAVNALPRDIPAFFRTGGEMVAHCSFDPDASKNRGAPYVRGAEYPEHFIDLEFLQGRALPEYRYAYIPLCAELGVKPEKVGFVPYAVAEWTERLAVAFAEHRKWPDNPHVQHKCLVYAGFLAHYAEDLCQPLHLTIHYNGRAKPDGSSPRSGIHQKVDALIHNLAFEPDGLARGQEIVPLKELMPGILREIEKGHALVDRVYELEDRLPSERGEKPASEVVDFATERAREAVRFTAALYLTAWERSTQIELPGWLDGEKSGHRTFR